MEKENNPVPWYEREIEKRLKSKKVDINSVDLKPKEEHQQKSLSTAPSTMVLPPLERAMSERQKEIERKVK